VLHQPHTILFRKLHGSPSEYQLRIPNHVCTLYGQNVRWKRKVLYPIQSYNPNITIVNLSQDISLVQYRLSICYTALDSPHSILTAHTHAKILTKGQCSHHNDITILHMNKISCQKFNYIYKKCDR